MGGVSSTTEHFLHVRRTGVDAPDIGGRRRTSDDKKKRSAGSKLGLFDPNPRFTKPFRLERSSIFVISWR